MLAKTLIFHRDIGCFYQKFANHIVFLKKSSLIDRF